MISIKSELEKVYLRHHKRGKRYGYLYCDGERGEYLQKWIGQGKKVLDLGCRDGMLTSYFAKENEVVGVDIDRKALQFIEEKLGVETRWLDLNVEWPFEPHSFDVIVACEIIEHLFLLEPFLDRVQKTLKPNGQFIGSVPNSFRMRNRFKFLLGDPYDSDPTHVRQFSHSILTHTLCQKFKEVEIVPLQGKVLPFLPVSAPLPYTLKRLFGKDFLWRCLDKSGE